MSGGHPIKDVARLSLVPGDTVVVNVDRRLSCDTAEQLHAFVLKHVPADVKVMVLDEGIRLQVLPDPDSELAKAQATINAAYTERNRLVAALARIYPSGVAQTPIDGWDPAWHGCCYIDLPTGQACWHYHTSDAHLFAGLPAYTKPWDGHSTPEKYERLGRLAELLINPRFAMMAALFRRLLARLGYRLEYVCSWGVYDRRYDHIDALMVRPIHDGMSVAPPWATARIVRVWPEVSQ